MLCMPRSCLHFYDVLCNAPLRLLFMQTCPAPPTLRETSSHSTSQSKREAAHLARYEADETPMVEYLNASNVVEQRRRAAREAGGQGPRTIVRCPAS